MIPVKKVFTDLGYTNFSGIPPIILSYEGNLSKIFSLGGMFIYTSAKAEYKYSNYSYSLWNNSPQSIETSTMFLGVIGNFHIYTNQSVDLTLGTVIGYASVSAAGETETTSVISTRFNAAIAIYFVPNWGIFARAGSWGSTGAIDLGTTIKF